MNTIDKRLKRLQKAAAADPNRPLGSKRKPHKKYKPRRTPEQMAADFRSKVASRGGKPAAAQARFEKAQAKLLKAQQAYARAVAALVRGSGKG